MSNFLFLQNEFPDLHADAVQVETHLRADPRVACFYARRVLENAIGWLYDYDTSLPAPYGNLNSNLNEPGLRALMPSAVWQKAKLIQRITNGAVHELGVVPAAQGWDVAREAFHLLFWLARTYGTKSKPADSLAWDDARVPAAPTQLLEINRTQLRKLQRELEARDAAERQRAEASQAAALAEAEARAAESEAELPVEPVRVFDLETDIKRLEAEKAKAVAALTPDVHDYSEKLTRDLLIDLLLKEAGWPLNQTRDREFPVTGMPSNSGQGYVDYVLWGDDGRPLAVVEAKKSRQDAFVGQQQAKLYADCLEAQYGRRPIIFYTNGYDHWLWDDKRYPPRPVQGFYKKDELELLIARRTPRIGLSEVAIDNAIVERAYQTRAIRRVFENLEMMRRDSLLVMATGTGKTRVSIALIDALMRAGWVKRILFLADRTALVNQTIGAFKTHLPSSAPVNLVTEKDETGAPICVSTYPTMMNLIERTDETGTRRFGVGHFDLIVIDEAHRSVYQKYRAIFEYFDSLLLGLTATPRDEVDRDTYALFNLNKGEPTDAYELSEAVGDGFLVPPRFFALPLQFPREGIKYSQLSDEDKEQWEEKDWGEDGAPDEVAAGAINQWLFNADTVDKVLETLWTQGLRVEGGDRLGKTIIFARNHEHAMFIQERFDANYPHLAGHFSRVIDNRVKYPQSLIDDFSNRLKEPHIAISVDMLDTGIDVPEVLNLVFFKPVRSKTKFTQMVGRGTRLSPNLFGPDVDKSEFYVFDVCQNLEYFEMKPDGVEAGLRPSLGQLLFEKRLDLLEGTRSKAELGDLRREWADTLHSEVAAMNPDNFMVRPHRRQLDKWVDRTEWEQITPDDGQEIRDHLAPLPTQIPAEEPAARQFDHLMLRLQLALLNGESGFPKLQRQIRELAANLLEKLTIPAVKAQEALLLEIVDDEWWEGVTLPMTEKARKALRDLAQYADKKYRPAVITDIEDRMGSIEEKTWAEVGEGRLSSHRKKVEAFVTSHKNHPTIAKLRQNEPLTAQDLSKLDQLLFEASGFEDRADFEAAFGPQPMLGKFVRSLVGLDREAAKKAFGAFLNGTNYSAAQIDFIDQIIDYLTQKGVMKASQLVNQPFNFAHPEGVEGIFPNQYDQIISIIKGINSNATVH